MCYPFLFSCSIEDGICTGLEIEQTATYDISVSVSECTPELLNGQTT